MPFHIRIATLIVVGALLASACSAGAAETQDTATTTSSTAVAATASSTTTVAASTTKAANPRYGVYFVGNSLSHQTLGQQSRGFRAWYVLLTQADIVADPLGWHIKCGSSLVSIASNPSDTCVDPSSDAGEFSEALPAEDWDFVSFQPYPGSGSTLASDIETITEMATSTRPEATVVVFTGWPRSSGFAATWDQQLTVADETPTTHARAYFEELVSRLGEALPNDVVLVPTAEVLYRLDEKLRAGAVPGLNGVADLFGDDVHLDSVGNWVSGVTMAAAVFGVDPHVFGKPSDPWYGEGAAFPDGFIQLTRECVAEVLS